MIAQLGEPKMWADFGLAGLVIFALFTAGILFLGWVIKHISTVTKMHHVERAEWRESGAKERAEWRAEHLAERVNLMEQRRQERGELLETMKLDRETTVAANDKMSNAVESLRDVLADMKK